MRMSKRQFSRSRASVERLQRLARAFAEYRSANKPGRRIPMGLRAQAVAAREAGVSAGAIQRACGVSWSQVTRWRSMAAAEGELSAPKAQVLTVVDAEESAPPSSEGGVELRVGAWRISLSHMVD